MEVEVELPAVAEFGRPGGQSLQRSSANFLCDELSDADERNSLQVNVAEGCDVNADLREVVASVAVSSHRTGLRQPG
ncbi:MAG TPA: hypothetical protein VN520_38675 [Streptomyces sp.]|uniref:hypothetical protein n=1 Tax=Streptomyces sp. TaxID=1931 RepID=UPI002C3BCD14|nr:hypothetical protein [Streptomyces sp.]HWU12207.1 hypothetical protein [Streptomyces sp.]